MSLIVMAPLRFDSVEKELSYSKIPHARRFRPSFSRHSRQRPSKSSWLGENLPFTGWRVGEFGADEGDDDAGDDIVPEKSPILRALPMRTLLETSAAS